MKNKLFSTFSVWMTLTGLILGTATAFAVTTAESLTKETQTRVDSPVTTSAGNTGLPVPATFRNPHDDPAGAVTSTSPINRRVDVSGNNKSAIIGRAANSGANGVTPDPEPGPMALFGVATIGLLGVMAVRQRRRHCTSG